MTDDEIREALNLKYGPLSDKKEKPRKPPKGGKLTYTTAYKIKGGPPPGAFSDLAAMYPAFTESMVPGLNKYERQAQRLMDTFLGKQFGPGVKGIQNQISAFGNANKDIMRMGLDPTKNKIIRNMVKGATSDIQQKYLKDIFPQIQSGAIAAGAVDSDRNAILKGVASSEMAREMGNVAADMYGRGQEYLTAQRHAGMQNISQRIPMLTSLLSLKQTPMQLRQQAGAGRRNLQAQVQADKRQMYEYLRDLPINMLGKQAGLLSGIPSGTSGTATVQQPNQSGGWGNTALDILGAGTSLYSMWPRH